MLKAFIEATLTYLRNIRDVFRDMVEVVLDTFANMLGDDVLDAILTPTSWAIYEVDMVSPRRSPVRNPDTGRFAAVDTIAKYEDYFNDVHLIPDDDDHCHVAQRSCECEPYEDDEIDSLVVHRAYDERETKGMH
jgi:hypothetical protein